MQHGVTKNVVSDSPEFVTKNPVNGLRFKRKRRGLPKQTAPERYIHDLVAIVIVVVPITIGMPPVAVFIPPAMTFVPAAFPRLAQFMARMIRLPAVPAVMLDGFVEFVVCLGDASLAAAVIIRQCTRRSDEGQHANKNRGSEHGLSEKLLLSHLNLHFLSILPYSPAGMGWGPVL
jgi:hypothetical protein